MFIVLDDVLTNKENNTLLEGMKTIAFDDNYQLKRWNEVRYAHPLLKITNKFFPLKRRYRYELWHNIHNLRGWHLDRDEILYEQGIDDHPLYGLIFYPQVVDVTGGQLQTENGIAVKPIQNRLILLDAGKVAHNVDFFTGLRRSFLINIWDKKQLGKK